MTATSESQRSRRTDVSSLRILTTLCLTWLNSTSECTPACGQLKSGSEIPPEPPPAPKFCLSFSRPTWSMLGRDSLDESADGRLIEGWDLKLDFRVSQPLMVSGGGTYLSSAGRLAEMVEAEDVIPCPRPCPIFNVASLTLSMSTLPTAPLTSFTTLEVKSDTDCETSIALEEAIKVWLFPNAVSTNPLLEAPSPSDPISKSPEPDFNVVKEARGPLETTPNEDDLDVVALGCVEEGGTCTRENGATVGRLLRSPKVTCHFMACCACSGGWNWWRKLAKTSWLHLNKKEEGTLLLRNLVLFDPVHLVSVPSHRFLSPPWPPIQFMRE